MIVVVVIFLNVLDFSDQRTKHGNASPTAMVPVEIARVPASEALEVIELTVDGEVPDKGGL